MSWWRAKYKNNQGEYEITFASKDYEKAKVVEKICQAIIDKKMKSRSDLEPLLSGWISVKDRLPGCGERVLATDGVFVGEAYRTSAKSWYRMTGFPWREAYGTVVKCWMPLPNLPKEDV